MTEFEIIERYFRKNEDPSAGVITGIGDDAALLELPEGHILAVSTDTLVNGVHFPENTLSRDVGYKSLAVNLSDLAAVAAKPLWATLSLTIPEIHEEWLAGFSEGFFELADHYRVKLVGGDISRGPLSITVQIMGSLPRGGGIRRSGARPGNLIYVSGHLGMAAYALSILKGNVAGVESPPEPCLQKLNRPDPRVSLGQKLRDVASAAIDISDGLAGDLSHILDASNVGAEIRIGNVPVSDGMKHLSEEELRTYCLYSGDDYELCFTVDEQHRDILEDITGEQDCLLTCIGRIIPGRGITWLSESGGRVDAGATGFRHF